MKQESIDFRIFSATREQWIQELVPQPFRGMRLSSYPQGSAEHRSALRAAQQWCAGIRAGVLRPLVLFGRPGSGKTMLASCAFNELAPGVPDRASSDSVQRAGTADNICFVGCAGLVGWLRPDTEQAQTPAQKRNHLQTSFLCCLDDLDKHPAGEWGNEFLGLVGSRVWGACLPTILTMNLSPPELAGRYGQVGAPLLSRLTRAGGVFIRLDGRPTHEPEGVRDGN